MSHNLKTYNVALTDLILVSKGRKNDTIWEIWKPYLYFRK
jgi:hypothetical protein